MLGTAGGGRSSGTVEQSYTYNPTGDRLSKTVSGTTQTYGYTTGTHQLTTVGSTTRTVDAAGNTTAMTDAVGAVIGLGYDNRNRLTTVTQSGSTIGSYQYNGLGDRVWRTITSPSAGTAATVYDPTGTGNLYGEYFATDYREYVYLAGIPVAAATDAGKAAPGISSLYADHLGTVRAVVNSAGTTTYTWPWLNNAFGEQPSTGTSAFYTRFPGQYWDEESGLFYNHNRLYDAMTGRYVQSDPIGLNGGISTYAYVTNNPPGGVDPDGLCKMGHWTQVGSIMLNLDVLGVAGTLISNSVCRCVWLWVSTEGPYMWSGDPTDPTLPRTTGQPIGMSGDPGLDKEKHGGHSLTAAPDSCMCTPPPPKD